MEFASIIKYPRFKRHNNFVLVFNSNLNRYIIRPTTTQYRIEDVLFEGQKIYFKLQNINHILSGIVGTIQSSVPNSVYYLTDIKTETNTTIIIPTDSAGLVSIEYWLEEFQSTEGNQLPTRNDLRFGFNARPSNPNGGGGASGTISAQDQFKLNNTQTVLTGEVLTQYTHRDAHQAIINLLNINFDEVENDTSNIIELLIETNSTILNYQLFISVVYSSVNGNQKIDNVFVNQIVPDVELNWQLFINNDGQTVGSLFLVNNHQSTIWNVKYISVRNQKHLSADNFLIQQNSFVSAGPNKVEIFNNRNTVNQNPFTINNYFWSKDYLDSGDDIRQRQPGFYTYSVPFTEWFTTPTKINEFRTQTLLTQPSAFVDCILSHFNKYIKPFLTANQSLSNDIKQSANVLLIEIQQSLIETKSGTRYVLTNKNPKVVYIRDLFIGRLYVVNLQTNIYKEIMFDGDKISADQVQTSSSKLFVTQNEKNAWNAVSQSATQNTWFPTVNEFSDLPLSAPIGSRCVVLNDQNQGNNVYKQTATGWVLDGISSLTVDTVGPSTTEGNLISQNQTNNLIKGFGTVYGFHTEPNSKYSMYGSSLTPSNFYSAVTLATKEAIDIVPRKGLVNQTVQQYSINIGFANGLAIKPNQVLYGTNLTPSTSVGSVQIGSNQKPGNTPIVIGSFNQTDNDAKFVVAQGTADNARKNILTVTNSGNLKIDGFIHSTNYDENYLLTGRGVRHVGDFITSADFSNKIDRTRSIYFQHVPLDFTGTEDEENDLPIIYLA